MQYLDQQNDESLKFSVENNSSMPEHLLQYAAARDYCKGKKVLDISACAGYGPYLMAEWGAKEVISICLSSAHKSERAAHLYKDNVKFIYAPPEGFTSKLIGEKFDLIISLSSIQNSADPEDFLSEMRNLLNNDGAIIFSFKSSADPSLVDDSHYLERRDHHGYKELSESILGKATFWGGGSPVFGYHFTPDDEFIDGDARPATYFASQNPTERNLQFTNDLNSVITTSNVTHHFGMWGIKNQTHSAMSLPASISAYFGMCEQTGQLMRKIEVLEAELARQAAETASYRTLLESNVQDFPGIDSQFSAFNNPSKWERRLQKWKKSIKKRLK